MFSIYLLNVCDKIAFSQDKGDIMKKLKKFFMTQGRYVLPAILYFIMYFAWFHHLEIVNTGSKLHLIHTVIDDKIPFCEYFVIPYLAWFFYVFIVMAYLFLENKNDFLRSCIFLFTGMTVFLIVSTVWPNGQHLRPTVMPRDNFFTHLVTSLYAADTPTNIFPSIHVYNSIGCNIAVHRNENLKKHKGILIGSTVLSTLIILSTMFIKQHSFLDVMAAILMAAVMYVIAYRYDLLIVWKRAYYEHRAQRERTEEI